MWRVHHAQCPDPKGRVLFEIAQTAKIHKANVGDRDEQGQSDGDCQDDVGSAAGDRLQEDRQPAEGSLHNLRVVVEQVRGKCTSGMRPGDYFVLHSGRLMIPPNRHFCLYALQAVVPLLPAKQRPLMDGDWLKEDNHVICPDPAGNVIMRIEPWP
ncbi:MAG: TIGR04076 family protein [Anaerolineae bacterium]|nr:TIGR04076 family protein [Anaerolineae bacterium]